ncbi:hypothetical protein QNN00_13265 [Bacillus velezensis]|nr:hypothetical protein [Bacillus velezensis]
MLDCEVKVMNWGYWGSLGVVSDPSYRKRMEASGIGSIEPDEAMEALEVLLSEPFSQAAFIKGRSARLSRADGSRCNIGCIRPEAFIYGKRQAAKSGSE